MSVTARASELLRAAGMTAAGVELAERGFEASERAWLRSDGADREPQPLFVPGRIEVLGKHTDYAGGTTLTCGVERGICAIHAPRRDNRVVIIDALRNDRIEFVAEPDMAIRSGTLVQLPDDGGEASLPQLRTRAPRLQPGVPEHAAKLRRPQQFQHAHHLNLHRLCARQRPGLPPRTSATRSRRLRN